MGRKRIFVSTQGPDSSLLLVGGPEPGSDGNVGLILDAQPTTTRQTRIMVRLASVFVPQRTRGIVVDISQLLTICATVDSSETQPLLQRNGDPPTSLLLFEKQVVTPMWKFPDGNVSWHLRRCPADQQIGNLKQNAGRGYCSELYQCEPDILVNNLPAELGGYIPPCAGIIPGEPISDFGTWRDMRFPYRRARSHEPLGIEVVGPCIICLYASVWQTDPATRLYPGSGIEQEMLNPISGLEPEDQFWVNNYLTARYYRIGAELTVDLEPLPALPKGTAGGLTE